MKNRIPTTIFLGGILILSLIIETSCSPSTKTTCIGWEFNTNGDTEGWKTSQEITQEVLDGNLMGDITKSGGYWVGPDNLNIDSTIYKLLEMRYRINSPEIVDITYFYWTRADDLPFGNDKRIKFDIQTDNEWQTVTVNLDSSVNWDGIITGIQLEPVLFSDPITMIEYDYIRLCK